MTDPAAEVDHYHDTHPDDEMPHARMANRPRLPVAGSDEADSVAEIGAQAPELHSQAQAMLQSIYRMQSALLREDMLTAQSLYLHDTLAFACEDLRRAMLKMEQVRRAAADGPPDWYDPDAEIDVPF